MATHVAVKSPDDWAGVAERELKNLFGAYYAKQSNDVRIDHALKAVEAILKAIIWKRYKWPKWQKVKGHGYLYNHDLEGMLTHSGFRDELLADPERKASWDALVNAGERQLRYSPDTALPTDNDTHQVAKAARHPDVGVVPWLQKRYRQMT